MSVEGVGVQDKSAKIFQFPDKKLVISNCTHHIIVITKQHDKSIRLPFSMLKFALMQTFALGSMHTGLKGTT